MIMYLRHFISINRRFSKFFNDMLPISVQQDGNSYFRSHILPKALWEGATVYDVGGGSQPFVDKEMKQRFGLKTVGIDIDGEELAGAPPGTYDSQIIADLCSFNGKGDADIVICQATLEHVADTRAAIISIVSILKPNGQAYIFAPSRNAAFARINLILAQKMKERILYTVSPEVEDHQGFPARYDQCVPSKIEEIFNDSGLLIKERYLFWMSSYFMIFTPLFIMWRFFQGIFYLFAGKDAAETFIYVVQRKT